MVVVLIWVPGREKTWYMWFKDRDNGVGALRARPRVWTKGNIGEGIEDHHLGRYSYQLPGQLVNKNQ